MQIVNYYYRQTVTNSNHFTGRYGNRYAVNWFTVDLAEVWWLHGRQSIIVVSSMKLGPASITESPFACGPVLIISQHVSPVSI